MIAGGRSWLAAAATAKPSRSGIWISRNTRSGAPRRSSSTASRPLAHSSMRVTLPICCSTPRSRRRAGASSSTIIARMIGVRNLDRRQRAPPLGIRRVRQLETVPGAVQLQEPSARVGDSQPAAVAALGLGMHARAIVADREMQAIAFTRRGDLDFRDSGLRRDRKSTRLNSSHRTISYAVFCLKKKKIQILPIRLYNKIYINK